MVERAKSLRLPQCAERPPWKKLPAHLIVEVLIHEEILAENSTSDQLALRPYQARCSEAGADSSQIRCVFKVLKEV